VLQTATIRTPAAPVAPSPGSPEAEYAEIRARQVPTQLPDKRVILRDVPLEQLRAFVPLLVARERQKMADKELLAEKAAEGRREAERKELERNGLLPKPKPKEAPPPPAPNPKGAAAAPKAGAAQAQPKQPAKAAAGKGAPPPVEEEAKPPEPPPFVAPSSVCWLTIGNRSLQSLSLARNPFGMFGAQCIAKAVEVNDALQVVYTGDCDEVAVSAEKPADGAAAEAAADGEGHAEDEFDQRIRAEEAQAADPPAPDEADPATVTDAEPAAKLELPDLDVPNWLPPQPDPEVVADPAYDPFVPFVPSARAFPEETLKARVAIQQVLKKKYPSLYDKDYHPEEVEQPVEPEIPQPLQKESGKRGVV
jgi:hypothetical protein